MADSGNLFNPNGKGFRGLFNYIESDEAHARREQQEREDDEERASHIRAGEELIEQQRKLIELGKKLIEPISTQMRSKLREEWINGKLAGQPRKVITDHPKGPSRNTLRRYESGEESTQDGMVRGQLASVFNCPVTEVPQ